MVEVKGVYKDYRYEKHWLNSLRAMSDVKVFAMQDCQLAGRRPAGRPDEHYSFHRLICYSFRSIKKK